MKRCLPVRGGQRFFLCITVELARNVKKQIFAKKCTKIFVHSKIKGYICNVRFKNTNN